MNWQPTLIHLILSLLLALALADTTNRSPKQSETLPKELEDKQQEFFRVIKDRKKMTFQDFEKKPFKVHSR